MLEENGELNPFERMKLNPKNCFLCGKNLDDSFTREHVFPKWLLNNFDLWNKSLNLLNRTQLKYRFLTIPCCQNCNNEHLSKLETIIQNGFYHGFDEFREIEELYIFQWISKIFFGILNKELFLLIDRSNPKDGTIIDSGLISSFETLHAFIQTIRSPGKFEIYKPWSIFLVKLKNDQLSFDFDYRDEIDKMFFSIRMGEIGIIMCMDDNGAIKDYFDDYYNSFIINHVFNHLQFDQLCAQICYQKSLLNFNAKYITLIDENSFTVVPLPLKGYSTKPLFNEFVLLDYAKYLYSFLKKWDFEFEDIYKESVLILELIHNNDNSFHEFSI